MKPLRDIPGVIANFIQYGTGRLMWYLVDLIMSDGTLYRYVSEDAPSRTSIAALQNAFDTGAYEFTDQWLKVGPAILYRERYDRRSNSLKLVPYQVAPIFFHREPANLLTEPVFKTLKEQEQKTRDEARIIYYAAVNRARANRARLNDLKERAQQPPNEALEYGEPYGTDVVEGTYGPVTLAEAARFKKRLESGNQGGHTRLPDDLRDPEEEPGERKEWEAFENFERDIRIRFNSAQQQAIQSTIDFFESKRDPRYKLHKPEPVKTDDVDIDSMTDEEVDAYLAQMYGA